MSTQRDVESIYINAAHVLQTDNDNIQGLFDVCKGLMACCCVSSLTLLVIGLIGGVVCLYLFSILGLVNNWDTVGECNSSHLRELVITYLILCWLQAGTGSSASKSNDSDKVALVLSLVIMTLLCGGIAIWSGIEVLDLACSDIEDTILYGVGLAIFIFNTIISGIGFLGVVGLVIVATLNCLLN